ncbi:hypothetical protein [Candidatus Viridilinea mediisalina]|nr:hypothetical protein [Candidatus Viridilinea mediisalina]
MTIRVPAPWSMGLLRTEQYRTEHPGVGVLSDQAPSDLVAAAWAVAQR